MSQLTLTFSQDSEDSQLPLRGLDSEPLLCVSVTSGVGVSLHEPTESNPIPIYVPSTDDGTAALPFLPEDRRASQAVEPGSNEARLMTAGSGRKLCECLRKSSRMVSFSKRLLESSIWTSTESFLRWSGSGTRFRHSIFRLVPWTPLRSGSGTGSLDFENGTTTTWPTPVVSRHGAESNEARRARGAKTGTTLVDAIAGWPTPRSRDIKDTSDGQWAMNRQDGKSRTDQLPHALKTWPTPNASDGSGGPAPIAGRKKGKSGEKHSTQLADYIGSPSYGCLAKMDTFVERLTNLSMWLQGFTAQYLRHWEMRSSPKSRTKSSST